MIHFLARVRPLTFLIYTVTQVSLSLFSSSPTDHYFCPGQPGSPDLGEAKKPREAAGLDLSFKRDEDDHETDTEREEAANIEEEERNEDSDDGNVSKQSYQGGGRSRRKPAVPQWVNPFLSGDQELASARETDGDSRTINGVCVVNFPRQQDNGAVETEAGE